MPVEVMASLAVHGYPDTLRQEEEKSFYANIIRLRDEIVTGTHPRLSAKIPDRRVDSFPLLPFPLPPPPLPPQEVLPKASGNQPNDDGLDSKYSSAVAIGQPLSGSRVFASQVDSELLTDPDQHIKTEIQIKRQRIERALKDQVDQKHKELTQKSSNSDILPDFDVTEVLRQAHARVKPATAQDESDQDSSSFDDGTFYSSVDNRSSPGTEIRSTQTTNGDQTQPTARAEASSSQQAVFQDIAVNRQHQPRDTNKTHDVSAKLDHRVQVDRGGPTTRQDAFGRMIRGPEPREDRYIPPPGLGLRRNDIPSFHPPAKEASQESFDPYTPSLPVTSQEVPFIANRISSPVAPQPARISPLAIAKEPPYMQSNLRQRNASPVQDAQPLSANRRRSSNDSPRQVNPRKKRRITSEKGRKVSSRVLAESPEIYIKPEPVESPPLLSAAPIPHPKRRHQPQGSAESHIRRHFSPSSLRSRTEFGPPHPRYQDDARQQMDGALQGPPQAGYVRIVRDHNEPPRYVENHLSQPVSPYGTRYPIPEQRPVRAISQYVERPTISGSTYYLNGVPDNPLKYIAMERPRSPMLASERYSPAPIRMSMAPPPVTRIAIDKYGREIMTADPPQITRHTPMPATIRESVPPQLRHREVESQPVSYRVQSNAPHAAYHDEHRYVEMMPARPMSTAHNIQDQPVTTIYRPREYSNTPIGLSSSVSGGYARPQERRPYSPGQGREPGVLPRSRRPMSPGNEGLPREYIRQPQGIRPEQGSRIYEQGLTLDTGRPDMVPGAQPDFSVRLEDSGHQQFAPSSGPRYLVPPQRIQYVEESRYAERPRDSLPDVYGHTIEMHPRR
jgi:hypothetical protein